MHHNHLFIFVNCVLSKQWSCWCTYSRTVCMQIVVQKFPFSSLIDTIYFLYDSFFILTTLLNTQICVSFAFVFKLECIVIPIFYQQQFFCCLCHPLKSINNKGLLSLTIWVKISINAQQTDGCAFLCIQELALK